MIKLEELLNKGFYLCIDILIALIVLMVGLKLIKLLDKGLRKHHKIDKLDPTVKSFMISGISISLRILLVVIVASIIGLPTTSLITIIGSCGVTIGLALQGGLSNLAGGIIILLFKPFKEGKVREVYDNGESLIIVATDRISAFDHILKNKVTNKGAILTQMSRFWFDFTKDIVPNHMLSVDVKDMPEFFQNEKYDGNSMMCKKLEMIPIECIVRGYITGSGWASYKENGTVCGIKLPEGLVESDKLPEPIYTPSTKAEIGDHDENISFEQSIDVLEKAFPGKGAEYAEKIKEYTIALYKKCAEYALSKGIIIADTKFEFGLDENGNVVLGDEMLTPDSSRFWPLEGYKPGQGQPSYDKQFVRDWLKANPDSDYLLPDEVIKKTIEKYEEAFELLTGKKFA